ncbi:hypothetical protein [Nocardia blacklockiae]|uniref:hypothetical protein n=1 Tax=Nocardia blacklockiae TaxID=480036 RepID=UPI001893ED68|nr:hypothetical protein [Nocardia blacklockiae]MBF6174655.1 hypothetical protein [Nocardia blacklockiae]
MTRENEGKKIPGAGENVFGWSRGQIEDAFSHLDTADAQRQAQQYGSAATYWDQGLETFKRSVHGSIAEAWEGAAAESAKRAITQYVDEAVKLTDLLSSLSTDIKAAADNIVQTKKNIKPAAAHSWTANIPFFGRGRAAEEERSRNQAESESRQAMLDHYVTPFGKLDENVPLLPPSFNPTQPGGVVPGGDTWRPGGDDSGNPVPGGTGPNGTQEPKPENGTGSEEQQSGSQDGRESPGSDDSRTETAGADPNAASPAGTGAGASTTAAGVSPSGVTGGGHTGGTSGMGGSGPTPGGGPGRSVPGTGVPGAGWNPAAAAARGGAGTAGAPGMGGMPGMGGAGRGKGEGDEDRDHKTPDYLINAANAEELLGETPRTIPGGVIGGDYGDSGRTDR